MVNTAARPPLQTTTALVRAYVAVAVARIAVVALLSVVAPDQATSEAWGHVIIVGVFALVLPLRLRSAKRGSGRAVRAVGMIAAVLLVVNIVEAAIPGLFPVWLRIEMIGIAALMAAVVATTARAGKQ